MHAAGKTIRRHEQRARRTVATRRRKSRHAVTAEAGRVVEIGSALRARGLHPNEDGHQHECPQRKFASVHGPSSPASDRRTRGTWCRALTCSIRNLMCGFTQSKANTPSTAASIDARLQFVV